MLLVKGDESIDVNAVGVTGLIVLKSIPDYLKCNYETDRSSYILKVSISNVVIELER